MCENFQVYSKCHLSVLSGHFDGPLLVMSATKEASNKTKGKQKTGTHAYRKHKSKKLLYKQIWQTGTDCKITMKEISPIAGIDRKNTMTKLSHAEGTDHQGITKIIMKESIIHFRTMEIGENIKRVIKTSMQKKIINIREGLEIFMKMSIRTGTVGMNMNTNT